MNKKYDYTIQPHNVASKLKIRQTIYKNKIRSTPLPNTQLLDYKYDDLFSMLKPLNEISAEYRHRLLIKKIKSAKQQVRNRARNNDLDDTPDGGLD